MGGEEVGRPYPGDPGLAGVPAESGLIGVIALAFYYSFIVMFDFNLKVVFSSIPLAFW